MTNKLHVDATLVAAHRMAELQAENEQLRAKLAEHETLALKLDAHEDASTPAFDEIVKLCGLAKTWEYPGQVIRDVKDALAWRDARIAQLEAQQRAPHPHAPEKCPACNWVNTNLTNYGEPSKPLWRCHSCAALDMRRVGDLDKQNQKLVAAAVDSPLTDKTTRGEIEEGDDPCLAHTFVGDVCRDCGLVAPRHVDGVRQCPWILDDEDPDEGYWHCKHEADHVGVHETEFGKGRDRRWTEGADE